MHTEEAIDLITMRELAALLRLGYSTVVGMRAAGEILAPLIDRGQGGKILWDRGDVLAWMHAGCPKRDDWQARKDALARKRR